MSKNLQPAARGGKGAQIIEEVGRGLEIGNLVEIQLAGVALQKPELLWAVSCG